MLDERFTQQLQAWLDTPSDSRDLATGAELLLRLNKNRWMHQLILKKRNFTKLEYELKKYLRIRLEGLTKREVVAMEQTVLPLAIESINAGAPVISTDDEMPEGNYRGKRPDHDTLPQELQELYERSVMSREHDQFAVLTVENGCLLVNIVHGGHQPSLNQIGIFVKGNID